MSYASLLFLVFIVCLSCIYYILPKKIRWTVLLIGSLIFYYLFSDKYIIFIILASLITYGSGFLLEIYKKKKIILISSIIILLSFLGVLKYNNFIASLINPIIGLVNIKIPYHEFLLPIGISYYTLDMIGYLTDIYRNKYTHEKNYFKLLTFFTFFPKIVEGPFCKYDKLKETLFGENKFDYERFKSSWVLIGYGFIKKLVIADKLGMYVNHVFTNNLSGLLLIAAIVLYTIQIYCDFSGCIDIITGVSELFGVKLPKNFRQPFFAESIQDFWRRWHITLGEWLKEYIFYPISLSKLNMKLNKSVRKWKNIHLSRFIITAFPLFFVWFVNGIWHGPSWQYILYGLYYYILMMIGVLFKPLLDKLVKVLKINTKKWYYKLFCIARTLIIVCFGLFLFRCNGLEQFITLLPKIFSFKSFELTNLGITRYDLISSMFYFICIIVIEIFLEKGIDVREKLNNKNLVIRWIVYLIIIFSIVIFGAYGKGYEASSFIYGGF